MYGPSRISVQQQLACYCAAELCRNACCFSQWWQYHPWFYHHQPLGCTSMSCSAWCRQEEDGGVFTNCMWGVPLCMTRSQIWVQNSFTIHCRLVTVCVGCVCLDLLWHMRLLHLKYVICSYKSIFRSLWDDNGSGRTPLSCHLQSQSVVEKGPVCVETVQGSRVCGCLGGSAGSGCSSTKKGK